MVYFFDKPTVGYCKHCERFAEWDSARGLYCPACGNKNLSIFKWDEESEYPE
jgi:Zn finger protein HypA/HybF involved in hydrogenase expression